VDTQRKADTVAKMEDKRSERRPRRKFTDEFKDGAVKLVLDEKKAVAQVAHDLDLAESVLRGWMKQAQADRSKGKTGLTTEERAELAQLRRENRVLRMERDILKKAAAFFAKESA
jgi:transposase